MRVPEEPVCIDLFRENLVFTSLHLKYPVRVVQPLRKPGTYISNNWDVLTINVFANSAILYNGITKTVHRLPPALLLEVKEKIIISTGVQRPREILIL